MDFAEASKLARENPGSRVTREGDAFVVVLRDGHVLRDSACSHCSHWKSIADQAKSAESDQRAARELLTIKYHRLQNLLADSEEKEIAARKDYERLRRSDDISPELKAVDAETQAQRAQIQNLMELLEKQHRIVETLQERLAQEMASYKAAHAESQREQHKLESVISELRSQMTFLDPDVMRALKAAHAKEMKDAIPILKGLRIVRQCPCGGLTTRCQFCGGAGQYEVDGLGNRL